MTGNLRSRHAFHNTFGENIPENGQDKKFSNQSFESYSNTSSVSHPFQNQVSSQHTSAHTSSIYTNVSSIGSEPSLGNRSNVSSISHSHGSNVSSPFPKTQSLPINATSSPFSGGTSVPNPNLVGNYGHKGTSVNQDLQYDSNPILHSNVNPPTTGFTSVPTYNPGGSSSSSAFQNTGYGNFASQPFTNTTSPLNQSHKPEEKSTFYFDGKLNQNGFTDQYTTNSSLQSNPSQPGLHNNLESTTFNINSNAISLSNLAKSTNATQPFRHTQPGLSPLQSQLEAQLTKFGEIYNQRLQQSESDDEVDPPLLDELGINVVEIYSHMVSVMLPKKGNSTFLNYDDLYGPLIIFVAFAVALMVSGKICFSTIYVLFVFCNLGIYMLFNFLNETYVSFSKTVTILGYSLLPLCGTPVLGLLSRFIKVIPVLLVYVLVLWSTVSASYLFQVELNLKSGLHFIMYPILLYYATFANVVIY